ncbi:hypothetical protein CAI21_10565 [Alkalilimnicola ehrlichii]|uniref:Dual-action ribosomal maturation protein DarP n=1 Tax=Alkalilimnicola ehrlichii TaxID=351052 RepID=A0A3E0WT18_9GAMM|nr:ribosome biogenesis factor YjgA [Alkalilimnicola ehrlichii]RFA29203.1 hypothetical protein CAI21_10565 [Alkalilimnicola ehrlichii]RFA36114.1 hypothetical protein CAL65_11705 [Alkalilimnicola ehrlichii]
MEPDDLDNDGLFEEGPSRSQRKREAHALKHLGEQLVTLPNEQLNRLPLSDALLEAIALAKRIKAHGGRRRQLQLIGKLLRQEDAEPIQTALQQLSNQHEGNVVAHHQAERWRERLLEEGDTALAEFMSDFPAADAQRLRQLIRAAKKEYAANKPPKSYRELFRLIRSQIG